jgi:hypothetical protein
MYRPIAAACAALALAACATPTVYGPANPNAAGTAKVGFSEYRIENNRYRVTFQGGGGAPQRQMADYALLRSAEITLRDGYDWFQVVDRFGDANGSQAGSGPRLSIGGGSSSYGGRYGRYSGSGIGVGIGTSVNLGGGPAYAHTVEILLGRGPKPNLPEVYDARGVAAALAPNAPRY